MTSIVESDDYFVFISYSSKDVELAKWLQFELEHYHLPATMSKKPGIRKNLRKVFRDRTELSAGNLGEQIEQALANSTHLVVVCSPNSAKSHWVDLEVRNFIRLHNLRFDGTDKNKILPFIIEGKSPNDYFTPTIIKLGNNNIDLLGGDINEDGKDGAFIKVVSGLLNQKFDTLWQRYARDKVEEERKERERKDDLLRLQSLFLAEKSMSFIRSNSPYRGCAYALEALPCNIAEPERPIVSEAKEAFLRSVYFEKAVLGEHGQKISKVIFNNDGRYLISSSWDNAIKIWDIETGRLVRVLGGVHKRETSCIACMHMEDKELVISASFDSVIVIWELNTGKIVKQIKSRHFKLNSLATYQNSLIVSYGDGAIAVYNMSNIGGRLKAYYLKDSHTESVLSVACNGKYIVSGSIDKTIRVWDFNSKKLLKVLNVNQRYHNHWITTVHIDNDIIVSGSLDKRIQFWETKTWEPKQSIIDEGDYIGGIQSLLLYSNYLFSGSDSHTVKIWSKDGICLLELEAGSSPVLCVSYNGKYLVAGDTTGTIFCYMIRKSRILLEKNGAGASIEVPYIGFSTDSIHEWDSLESKMPMLLSQKAIGDDGSISIDESEETEDKHDNYTSKHTTLSLKYLKEIELLLEKFNNPTIKVVCANGFVLTEEGNKSVRIRDISTGIIVFEDQFDEDRDVFFNLHGQLAKLEKVTSIRSELEGKRAIIKVFDGLNKQWIGIEKLSKLSDFILDPLCIDGDYLYCKTFNPKDGILIIDLFNCNCFEIPIRIDTIQHFSFHKDTFFYSRPKSNVLYSYNTSTQKKKKFMRIDGKVSNIVCFKDALTVCSNDNSIYIIDYITKQVIRMIKTSNTGGDAYLQVIRMLKPSYTGENVYLNGDNLLVESFCNMSIYDVASGELIDSIELNSNDICCYNEKNIVIDRSEGNTIVFGWPISFQKLVDIKKDQFKESGLSEDEKKQYFL